MTKGVIQLKFNSLLIVMLISLVLFVVGCSMEEVEKPEETQSSLPEYTFEKGVFPPSPSGFVKVEETRYEMAKGGFRWEMGNMASETDVAGPTQIAEHFEVIEVGPSSEVDIEVEQKPKLSVLLWEDEEKASSIQLGENQLTMPTEEGRYIYEVRAGWQNGEVSYTFVVEVK